MKLFGDFLYIIAPIVISLVLGSTCGKDTGLLCYGIYSVIMLFNMASTALTSAILSKYVYNVGDVFWKTFFTLSASICLSLSLI